MSTSAGESQPQPPSTLLRADTDQLLDEPEDNAQDANTAATERDAAGTQFVDRNRHNMNTSPAFVKPTAAAVTPIMSKQRSDTSRASHAEQDLPGISVPSIAHPALFTEIPEFDPLTTLIAKHIPPHMRPARDLSGRWRPDEAPDLGLAIHTNSWRRVAHSARSRIVSYGAAMAERRAGAAGEVLSWWSLRIHALWRLRLAGQVNRELDALWSILEHTELHSSTSASSSSSHTTVSSKRPRYLVDSPIVPFSLQVLRARQPRLVGDLPAAVDRCIGLLRRTEAKATRFAAAEERASSEQQISICRQCRKMWSDRVKRLRVSIAGFMVELKDYDGAADVLRPLLGEDADATLLSCIARLYLQSGMLTEASAMLKRSHTIAEAELAQEPPLPTSAADSPEQLRSTHLKRMLGTDRALMAVAQGDYAAAESSLRALFPNGEWRGSSSSAAEADVDMASQLSNLAVVMFYQGHLEEPLEMLESLLKEGPSLVTSTDALVFNLATFHELGRDDATADKRRLLMEVATWAGEGGSTSALKLA